MKKLSVIIPAYNERDRIAKTLLEVSEFLQKQPFAYEVLVVNDGSRDDTAEVVSKLSKKLQNLQLIDLAENSGKGWAVKQGMLKATGDVRMFMDADNSTSITHLPVMLSYLGKDIGVVIGSIEVKGAKINERAQWYRRILGHWSKYLIRIVAGLWQVKDTQRGFKIFSQRAAEIIFNKQTIKGFGFDIEILAIAKEHGFGIKEVPVVWDNPAGSTLKLRNYLDVLIDLFKIRFKLWLGDY